MSREKEIKNALNDIKDLIKQNSNHSFHEMKNNILDLTDVVEGDDELQKGSRGHKPEHPEVDHGVLTQEIQLMLKPYLKSWLDKHLPTIVREIVDRQVQLIIDKSSK